MSIRQKIADWIDPARVAAAKAGTELVDTYRKGQMDLLDAVDKHRVAHQATVERLSNAAMALYQTREDKKRLRDALLIAKAHVENVYDEEKAALAKLGAKAKARIGQSAVVAALNVDLTKISNALHLTQEPVSDQPVQVAQ